MERHFCRRCGAKWMAFFKSKCCPDCFDTYFDHGELSASALERIRKRMIRDKIWNRPS